MLVFRVENNSGVGPYTSGAVDTIDYSRLFSPRCPGPLNDGIRRTDEDDHFAFKDVSQLRKWFIKRIRGNLTKKGFSMAIYRVPDKLVKHGKRQVVFKKSRSRLLCKLQLDY
jgi:hypothetical protein